MNRIGKKKRGAAGAKDESKVDQSAPKGAG